MAWPVGQASNESDFPFMNPSSAWTVALRCPHCGRVGSGAASEGAYDGQNESRLRIDGLSSGFVVVELRTGVGHDIRCSSCNSSALM